MAARPRKEGSMAARGRPRVREGSVAHARRHGVREGSVAHERRCRVREGSVAYERRRVRDGSVEHSRRRVREGSVEHSRRRVRVGRRVRAAKVVVFEFRKGYLVFNLSLKHIFSDQADDDVLRCFPRPLAVFEPKNIFENACFAGAGASIVAVTSKARTLVYDVGSRSFSAGPELSANKVKPALLRVGGGALFALDLCPRLTGTDFESSRSSSGDWRAAPELPVVADAFARRNASVTAYFVAGARVWVSVRWMGTFSFDTARRRWRREGAWLLPVTGRAILVGSLLFGLCSWDWNLHLCACDMEARPPVVRAVWEDDVARPNEWCKRNSYILTNDSADLAYFGAGRFCILRHLLHDKTSHRALCLVAVEVTADLRLLDRSFRTYPMQQNGRTGRFL